MNTQSSATKIQLSPHSLRIKILLERLKNKLSNFSILDSTGHYVGEIKDVTLDENRQLNLVVFEPDVHGGSRYLLLRSKHIEQVDLVSKSVFVDVSKGEINGFSDYLETGVETQGMSNRPQVIDYNAISHQETRSLNLDSSYEDGSQDVYFNEGVMTATGETKNTQEQFELSSDETEIVEQEVIRLLEERLVVEQNKRKIGDVIVRKEVETRMVQVPVRYEKLIVEQVSPERKQLAEIDLGGGEISGLELQEPMISEAESNGHSSSAVSGEFKSPKSASLFLNAIALQRHHGCAKVRVELVLEDTELESTYREWFQRCAGS